jgi:hypothetical protein
MAFAFAVPLRRNGALAFGKSRAQTIRFSAILAAAVAALIGGTCREVLASPGCDNMNANLVGQCAGELAVLSGRV